MYIDDCLKGIQAILASDILEPINLGSSELVSINQLVDIVEEIAGIKLKRSYNLKAPKGVNGRNSRQHAHQKISGLGAKHPPARRHGKDLPLDLRRDQKEEELTSGSRLDSAIDGQAEDLHHFSRD